jgi:hypothetical protein
MSLSESGSHIWVHVDSRAGSISRTSSCGLQEPSGKLLALYILDRAEGAITEPVNFEALAPGMAKDPRIPEPLDFVDPFSRLL